MTIHIGGAGPRKRAPRRWHPAQVVVGFLLLFASVAGCSTVAARGSGGLDGRPSASGEPSSSASTGPASTATPDPDSPTSTQDPSSTSAPDDASNAPPADSEVATLCNLTREFVQRLYDYGAADDWAYMDLSALSLSDSLRVWRGLVADVPAAAEDVDRAQAIFDLWQAGSAALTAGDVAEGEQLLADSLDLIDRLPSAAETEQFGCDLS